MKDDPLQRLAARLEERGHDQAVAGAMAKASARKLAPEHPVWALAAALDDLKAAQRWTGLNIHNFGPGRGPELTDELFDEAIARLDDAGARVMAALDRLAPRGA